MAFIENLVNVVNTILWDYGLLILLVGTGIYYTIRTKFVQVRFFGEGFRRLFAGFSLKGKKADKGGMSSFQALATAIAAQVGTGNVVGAATAIAAGGPGAIFWMWLSAFFGMATIYSEAVLAQKFKTVDADGNTVGGPVYYIKAAFKGKFGKFLAGFFSVAIILALGFMGNMVQSNSIGNAFETAFGVPAWIVGIVVALIAAFIFIGGVKRIASVTEKLVPIMAILYVIGSLVVLGINIGQIPHAFAQIFTMAFSPEAMGGGVLGITVMMAIRKGVARGLFSNEAGMGSTPHAHALAKVEKPHDQGVVAMTGVFIDTFIVLTCTALVIITSGLWSEGSTAAQSAFSAAFGGNIGSIFVAVCLLFFAFSTIVGWYFFGELNVRAMFGKGAVKIYAVIAVIMIALGSFLKVDLVWNMADMFNGLMVLPNLIALLALSGLVVKHVKEQKSPRQLKRDAVKS